MRSGTKERLIRWLQIDVADALNGDEDDGDREELAQAFRDLIAHVEATE